MTVPTVEDAQKVLSDLQDQARLSQELGVGAQVSGSQAGLATAANITLTEPEVASNL